MQVIIEYVLIENILINLFILYTCELFVKEKARLKVLNSIFGAIIALVFPLFNLSNFGVILLKICVGSIMVCVSFAFNTFKNYLYLFCSFALMTFAFGGASAMLVQSMGRTNVFVITLFSGMLFFAVRLFLKEFNKKKILRNFTYSVRLFFNGQTIDETGYFDSGNILYDEITKKPIVLITPAVFEKITGRNYYEFVLKNDNPSSILKNCHYVSASTSLSQGKMLVFELERLQIISKANEVKEFKSIFVGLSFANFEQTFASGLLLHSSLI